MKIENQLFNSIPTVKNKSAAEDIAGTFAKMFNDVNQNIGQADEKIAALASSKDEDIPGAMIALEKSDISVKLLLAVRNKFISAYQEITRMPI